MHGIERNRSDHEGVTVYKWHYKLVDGEINTTYRANESVSEAQVKSMLDIIEKMITDAVKRDQAKAQWLMDGHSIKTFGATEPNYIVTNNGKRISTPLDHHKKRWNESKYGAVMSEIIEAALISIICAL